MDANHFITQNPFPKNGAKLNLLYIKAAQDPAQKINQLNHMNRLLIINARLIQLIHVQYNLYDYSLSDVMSYMWDGIVKTVKKYDSTKNVPYYIYLIQSVRSIMQNDYNYKHSLVHIPIHNLKCMTHEYVDFDSKDGIIENHYTPEITSDIEDIITEYIIDYPNRLDDVEMLRDSTTHTHKVIAKKYNLSPTSLTSRLRRIKTQIKNYAERNDLL